MNEQNLELWLTTLENPTVEQAHAVLHKITEDGTVQMCCLGVGCMLADLPSVTADAEYFRYEDDDGDPDRPDEERYSVDGATAGDRFTLYTGQSGVDGSQAWSDEALGRSGHSKHFLDLPPVEFNEWLGLGPGGLRLDVRMPLRRNPVTWSPNYDPMFLHTLNDSGCTFPQIAQMIRHFGLTVMPDGQHSADTTSPIIGVRPEGDER